jgi:hypothetical protein
MIKAYRVVLSPLTIYIKIQNKTNLEKKNFDIFSKKFKLSVKMVKKSRVGQEFIGLMMRKEEKQEVMIGINFTHQNILLGKRVVVQVHLLSESIREGLEWTSYKEN